jgi:PAS domain S-box-containing protein
VIIMQGPEHVVEFVNDAHRRVFHSTDWVGKTLRAAFPSIEGQGFFELIDEVYATGEVREVDTAPLQYARSADELRETHYLTIIFAPLTDADGRVSGVFCEGFDVTKTRRTEEALRASQSRQALLVELGDTLRELDDPSDISYAVAELIGRALGVSRAGYGSIDLHRETISIERDWHLAGISSLSGTLHFREYGTYIDDLKRGQTVAVEDAGRDPRTAATAAALRSIDAAAFVNMPVTEQGGFVALLFVTHSAPRRWSHDDLTFMREVADRTRTAVERRRAEHDLRALAASLERQVAERTAERDRVWQNSRDLLVVVGTDGIFRAVNPAWTSILGHRPEEVVGRSFLDFIWPEDAERTQSGLDAAASKDALTNFVNRYRHRDGAARWISWHTSVEGDVVYAYGRDITTEKEQQEVLQATEAQLRQSQKMEAVGQLTGGLAHDFNNLLTGVTGSLELLNARIEQGRHTDAQRYIAAAQGAARRAAALTHRLLAFSRRQTLDPKPLQANRLIVGMEELIRRTVGPQIELEVVGAAGLWMTFVDPHQLENALLNLCINARDAMPGGGRLTIETGNKWLDARAARERGLDPGQYMTVCVSDTGTGMTPDVIARAFDPFFTTKPLGLGTGLGLSMIYGFAKQSGGQVRIYSEVGVGTMVCIYLPRYMGDAAAEEPGSEPAPGPRAVHGEQVLVVDDEATIRMLVIDVLGELGYAAIEAADGIAALKALQSDARIDLLITDVGLPGGMNGRQVADAGRALRPGLKVIFITGYAENAAIGNGQLEPGMQILTKPFAMADLASRVEELIEGR